MGVKRFNNKELKELFKDQCGPCIKAFPSCKGDTEKAKNFRCKEFFNGFVVLVNE